MPAAEGDGAAWPIADELRSAWLNGVPIAPFSGREGGLDQQCAYQVMLELHRRKVRAGARPVGRKIGFTNPALWDAFGASGPIWAPIYGHTVHPWRGPAQGLFSLAPFISPRLEPEIALQFNVDPPPGADLQALWDCVGQVAHAIEIVHCPYPGWRCTAPDVIAAAGFHGALLLGEPRSARSIGASAPQLDSVRVELFLAGLPQGGGVATNALGGPLRAVAHLMGMLARHGHEPLRAGEWISTGTLTPVVPVMPGQVWSTRLTGLGLQGIDVGFC